MADIGFSGPEKMKSPYNLFQIPQNCFTKGLGKCGDSTRVLWTVLNLRGST